MNSDSKSTAVLKHQNEQQSDYFSKVYLSKNIIELVDFLCREGTGMQYMQYLSKRFTTNLLKLIYTVKTFYLSIFIMSKTHIVMQKSCKGQLSIIKRVCA